MTEATIFIAALDKPTEAERAAFLAEACAGDERLRRRVEALLRAHAEPDDILDPMTDRPEVPGATSPSAPDGEQAGALVAGRYKLARGDRRGRHGHGLHGRAARAGQARMVALKLIKPGMDSTAVLARFEAERQALALMDHPNIAKILDGGDDRRTGRPFFVMELVKGVPLTDYCDAPPARASRSGSTLFVPDLLGRAARAPEGDHPPRPQAVATSWSTEHDGKPVPKVIDFGLAKATSGLAAHRADAVHRLRHGGRHAAVHGAGAGGDQRRWTSTPGPTSTRWA